ncbi:MAG: S8 family serine peptidase [Gemmatimonadales bacterium]
MSARQANVRRYGLAGFLVLLLILLPGELWSQQERLGRQSDLTAQEITTIRDQIRELNGRAIIGFKPVDEVQGMRPDGTPALASAEVAQLASDLGPLGVRVTIQYRIIPAVAATIDPDRLEELLADPYIDYVEPDYLEEPTAQSTPWGINRVNAPAAWTYTKGAGVSVGIIDTGIDEDHPDLNPIGGINLVTGGTTRADWDDNSSICSTHGTHVAGTVAALDNTIGVVGVAPEVDLYALRVFDPEAAGDILCTAHVSHSTLAIQWATENGLDVINMSLGGLLPSFAEADALFAAYSAGVFPVAAAGNDGRDLHVDFPAAQPYAIAVAAIDDSDDVASFSNAGPQVELAAPGDFVRSTWGGGEYRYLDGTSMASPHVAGVAALVRAVRPDLGVDEVRQVLRSTAQDIDAPGFDWASGYGVVDAAAAVAAVAPSNLVLSLHPGGLTLTVEPGGSSIVTPVEVRNVGAAGTINWTATDDASWITVSPTSGSASDVTPGQFNVTADPTGLDVGFHSGFVTVSGNAANSPVTLRVRLLVAPRIALDAGATTEGTLPYGERMRYLLAGTAGQKIDVAVLTDYSASLRLRDPVVRVYMPDGETGLDGNDMAPYAGLGLQALLYGVELPVTGDYVVEVAGWQDKDWGGYLLKARPAGPILGFSPWYLSERGERNGSNVNTSTTVFNLSGLGTLDWTCSSPDTWVSCSPTSGTVSQTGTLITLDDFTIPEVAKETGVIEQSEARDTLPDVAHTLEPAFVRALLGTGDYEVPE